MGCLSSKEKKNNPITATANTKGNNANKTEHLSEKKEPKFNPLHYTDDPQQQNGQGLKRQPTKEINSANHPFLTNVKTQNLILKVITLNYSGIMLSPFEFFPSQTDKEYLQLNRIFQLLLISHVKSEDKQVKDIKQDFVWNVGSIEKNLKKQRYAPLYNRNAGIKVNSFVNFKNSINNETQSAQCFLFGAYRKQQVQKNNLKPQIKEKQLQTYSQFQESWRKAFEPFEQKYSKNTTQIDETLKFDILCYKTILQYVYKSQFNLRKSEIQNHSSSNPHESLNPSNGSKKQEEQLISSFDYKKYEKFMNKFFDLAYINQAVKIEETIKKLKKLEADVIFLQQTSIQFRMNLKKRLGDLYYLEQCDAESAILINKKKFGQGLNSMAFRNKIQLLEQTNFNNDSIGLRIDNFIFICAHLSSKKQKNTLQKKEMILTLQEINKKHVNHVIILGGDMNSFIESVPPTFVRFPSNSQMITTVKKRTFMQTQLNKAEVIVRESKDQILSNKPMKKRQILTIDNEMPDQNEYLPTAKHPYDHYMVYAEVEYGDQKVIKPKFYDSARRK